MATTTTNFGWDIPQSTDLVKDGATAIAALGQDIDTAMVDLKGGTTGQVLAKASGTDLDFSWVAQDDSNAIQNAIVDAKGDLIAATANDTPARLAVGTNGHVLTADSTAATGIKWAAPAGGGKVLQVVNATSSTVVTNSTVTPADWISVSITPSSTSSRILLMFSGNMQISPSSNCFGAFDLFYNNSSTILSTRGFGLAVTTTLFQSIGNSFLHSPASTSALTYKIRLYKDAGGTSSVASLNDYSLTALEIGA